MGEDDGNQHQPTFVRSVAYSAGLRLGQFLVEIIVDLIGVYSHKGNRMSATEIEVPPLPVRPGETEEEYAERIRAAIRRGDEAYRHGRVLTHEQAMRRLARWLGD